MVKEHTLKVITNEYKVIHVIAFKYGSYLVLIKFNRDFLLRMRMLFLGGAYFRGHVEQFDLSTV